MKTHIYTKHHEFATGWPSTEENANQRSPAKILRRNTARVSPHPPLLLHPHHNLRHHDEERIVHTHLDYEVVEVACINSPQMIFTNSIHELPIIIMSTYVKF
jgi:hypothetical protein